MSYREREIKRYEKLICDGFFGKVAVIGDHKHLLNNHKLNLYKDIRESIPNNFKWHSYKASTVSSQVACLNHLFPIRQNGEAVLAILNGIYGEEVFSDIVALFKDKDEKDVYVAFEVVDRNNSLGEGASKTRIDALMVAIKNNKKTLIVFEWKYTELANNKTHKLKKCYKDLIKGSSILKKARKYTKDVYSKGDFYELMRQTLWAELFVQGKVECDNISVKVEDYLHLHVIPKENTSMLRNGCLEAKWKSCLKKDKGEGYKIIPPEKLFEPLAKKDLLRSECILNLENFINYLNERYWWDDFKEKVKETKEKLQEYKKDWSQIFNEYAEEIGQSINDKEYEDKGDDIKEVIKNYGITDEVQLYSSVSLAKQSSERTSYYDLRFRGQHICSATVSNGKINLHFSDRDQKNNELWFQIKSEPNSVAIDIKSQESEDFFKGLPGKGVGETYSPEHKLESLVLREMAKEKDKKVVGFRYMQPVKLGAGFFQMPTPLKGSTHEPIISIREHESPTGKNSKSASGGGIDILARVSCPGVGWRPAVIELKDKNTPRESVKDVMTQALIYATFLGHLLADEDCGEKWFNIFRDQGDEKKINGDIEILVIAMMPPKAGGTYDEINETPITFEVGDKKIRLIPCTCYVKTDDTISVIEGTCGSYDKFKKKG